MTIDRSDKLRTAVHISDNMAEEDDSDTWKRLRGVLSVFGDIASIIPFLTGFSLGGGTTIVIVDVSRTVARVILFIAVVALIIAFFIALFYFDYKDRKHRRKNRKF